MPIIYDIETLSGSGISSNDGIFMLDASDQTMSSAGSNKLQFARSFSRPVEATEDQFLTLNTVPVINENLTLEITPENPTVEILGNLLDPNGNTINRKTTFFKNTLLSSTTHTAWNTEDDISISLNGGPANKAYGVLEVARNAFGVPQYWALQYFNDNAQIIGEWRAGNINVAIPVGLTFNAEIGGGTPTITDNSKFAFTDSREFSKTVSATNGIFLTESEIDRVLNSIDSLSHLNISNSEYSFQRTLNPIHFQKNKSSLIFSNLSSLQAQLINFLLIRGNENFESRQFTANNKINDFFFLSSAIRRRFDITDLFPTSSLSDVNPGSRITDSEDVISENINGYINENYNYMVGVLAKVLNTTQSFVNLEIAKKIERGIFEELCFDNSNFVEGFLNEFSSSVNATLVGQNYSLLLNSTNDVKTAAIENFDFTSSALSSQSKIILSESSRKNIFHESNSQNIGFFSNGQPITFLLATTLSDKSDIYNITLDKFSEEAVNQNYSLVGSNEGKGFYLSEDERFEIIYGLTGSSPSVDSISFNESSGEYTVTLAGLDGGFSYQIEFDNILSSTYNTSGTITGIKTDIQTLPISNNFRIDLVGTDENQSVSFKLLESKDASLNDPSSSGEFSFGDIKFLRADELIDSQQTIDPTWIVRSSDVRKNFTASIEGSVQEISGEDYYVASINNTAGLVFDIQGAGFDFVFNTIETSVRGSDETITRNFKISENPYNFFRLSAFFSKEKDLFYHSGQDSESMSPLGLSEGWFNFSNNSGESPVIVSSGVEYTGDISISGFSMLFEFKNLIAGDSYKKVLPEFVQFESDTNIYLINGNELVPSNPLEAIIKNGVEFTAESSTHIAAIPYAISGSANLGNTESLLQQDRDFLLLEDSNNIIVGEENQFNAIVNSQGNVILTVDTAISVDSQGNIVNDRGDIIIPSSNVPSTAVSPNISVDNERNIVNGQGDVVIPSSDVISTSKVTSETNISVDSQGNIVNDGGDVVVPSSVVPAAISETSISVDSQGNIVNNQGDVVVDRDSLPGSEITEMGIDQTIELPFVENELMLFNNLSDIKFFIPPGTTTGILTP